LQDKVHQDDIVNIINFLIDNIFIEFGGRIFQQTVGIPMGRLFTSSCRFVVTLIWSWVCPKASS